MTPAAARTFMLYLLLAWLGVLAARLAWLGARRLRSTGPALRGGLELATGLAALGWIGWVVT
jgi:hypothetical protein